MAQERLFSRSTPEGERMRVFVDALSCVREALLAVNPRLCGKASSRLLEALIDASKATAKSLAMTVLFKMPMRSLQA